MAERYKIISEKDYTNYIFENCPIRIETIRILADSKTKKNLVQFKLINISDKAIDNITLKAIGYDVTDTALITVDDVLLGALDVKHREAFGGRNPIEMDVPRISYAKLFIKRVVFKDGEEWLGAEEGIEIEADRKKEIDFPENLYIELKKCADTYKFKAKCMYEEHEKYWRCSCGHLNNLTSDKCYYCGTHANVLKQCFSEDYLLNKSEEAEIANKNKIYELAKKAEAYETENKLQEAVKYYNQIKEWKDSKEHIELCLQKIADIKEKREEQIREEERRKAKKQKIHRIIKGICAVAVVIAIAVAVLFNNVFIPRDNYSKAEKLLEDRKYDRALTYYEGAKGYADSKEKIEYAKKCIEEEQLKIEVDQLKNELEKLFENFTDNENKIKEKVHRLDEIHIDMDAYYYYEGRISLSGDEVNGKLALKYFKQIKNPDKCKNLDYYIKVSKDDVLFEKIDSLLNKQKFNEALKRIKNFYYPNDYSYAIKTIKKAINTEMLGAYKLTSGVQWGENKYIHIAIEEGEISCYVWKNAHYTAYQQGSLRFRYYKKSKKIECIYSNEVIAVVQKTGKNTITCTSEDGVGYYKRVK